MISQANRHCGLLLIGIMLLTAACGTTSSIASGTSSTPSVIPSPTVTATALPSPTPIATATPVVAMCAPTFPTTPAGQLPTTIPLPPGTLIAQPIGINAGSAEYLLCTPAATQASITSFMNAALPASGWGANSPRACNEPSYHWYKGNYGMDIDLTPPLPEWALDICPHIGS